MSHEAIFWALSMDARTGILEMLQSVHVQEKKAQTVGLPDAYHHECQPVSSTGHLLTDWMDNDVFARRLPGQLERIAMTLTNRTSRSF